ncbi:MAG: radical SAM protein [Candidatus Omnitrophica bacterium]|nr:radical SAM protein [Candidatus Omnitrophota bacterium]
MKVLLINPPGWQKGSINLGLSYLAASLISSGHEVRIFDINASNQPPDIIAGRVAKYAPDLIGFSVKTATARSTALISRNIKKVYTRALHVAGGPHITLSYREFLTENPEFEYVFLGDSEISFADFINRISGGQDTHKVDGIAYRNQNEIITNPIKIIENLDTLPLPDFDVIDIFPPEDFRYPLLTSRGCPYACIYCCVGLLSGKKWRGRNPEKVIEELKIAQKRYGIRTFEILDDNFTLEPERAKMFCALLIKENLKLQWYCHNGIRADKIDLELARLMRKAGCTSVAVGIESGDENIFNSIRKGETLEDIVRGVKLIKQAGMRVVGYFIIGLPGDSLESIRRTIQFQQKLGLDDFNYGILNPYPGTTVWKILKEQGQTLLDIKDSSHFSNDLTIPCEFPGFCRNDIEEAYYQANYWDLYCIKERREYRCEKSPVKILFIDLFPQDGFLETVRKIFGKCHLDIFTTWHGTHHYSQKKDSGIISALYVIEHTERKLEKIFKVLKHLSLFRRNRYDLIFFSASSRKSIALAVLVIIRPRHLFFVVSQHKIIRFSWFQKSSWGYITIHPFLLFAKLIKAVLDIILYPLFWLSALIFGLFLYFKRNGKKVIFTKDKPLLIPLTKRRNRKR